MVSLRITATSPAEADLLIGLVLRGAVATLTDDLALARALCGAVLGPTLLRIAEQIGASPRLLDALHKATELEDLRDVFSRELGPSLVDIDARSKEAIVQAATSAIPLLVSGGRHDSTTLVSVEDS